MMMITLMMMIEDDDDSEDLCVSSTETSNMIKISNDNNGKMKLNKR